MWSEWLGMERWMVLCWMSSTPPTLTGAANLIAGGQVLIGDAFEIGTRAQSHARGR